MLDEVTLLFAPQQRKMLQAPLVKRYVPRWLRVPTSSVDKQWEVDQAKAVNVSVRRRGGRRPFASLL